MEIVLTTYELANQLPKEEKFGLRSQITRSSVSIPSNIAEGSAKASQKEYKYFLETSLGSAYELETQSLIIEKLGLGSKELINSLLAMVNEEQKMLLSFIRKVAE